MLTYGTKRRDYMGTILIQIDETLNKPIFNFEEGIINNTYTIIINVNSHMDFKSIFLNYRTELIKAIKEYIELNKYFKSKISDVIKTKIDAYLNGQIDLLEESEYIEIVFPDDNEDCDLLREYIQKNKLPLNKTLIWSKQYDITLESLKEIENILLYNERIHIKLKGNLLPVPPKDAKKTIEAIIEIVNKIKNFKLSPLEQTMLAYDIVRYKTYKLEDKNESITQSRDITNVILGDKIVCTGYINIFNCILENLGIKSYKYSYDHKTKSHGHDRSMVKLKDEKYGIDGIYFFDLTWDSRSHNNNDYLYSYLFFARTKNDIDRLSPNLIDETLPYDINTLPSTFREYSETNPDNIPIKLANTINRLSTFVEGKKIIDIRNLIPISKKDDIEKLDVDTISDKLYDYIDLFNKPINGQSFLKCFLTIRKIEYYINPSHYPLNTQNMALTSYMSNWSFKESIYEKLLALVGRTVMSDHFDEYQDYFYQINNQDTLDRSVEEIRLLLTLKRILEKK